MTNLILKKKTAEILLSIKKLTKSDLSDKISNKKHRGVSKRDISKEAETTYSHTVHTISDFEEQGLVHIMPSGRKTLVSLTDKGEKVAENISEINREIENKN